MSIVPIFPRRNARSSPPWPYSALGKSRFSSSFEMVPWHNYFINRKYCWIILSQRTKSKKGTRFPLQLTKTDMDKKPTDREVAARKAAFARAMERTSDLYHGDGDWRFKFMVRNGVTLEWIYSSRRKAEYELAIVRLGIAADLLRLDIREFMNYMHKLSRRLDCFPDAVPEIGLWTSWLPMASEVRRTPKGRNYFDKRLW